jgi:hypothetical protein
MYAIHTLGRSLYATKDVATANYQGDRYTLIVDFLNLVGIFVKYFTINAMTLFA